MTADELAAAVRGLLHERYGLPYPAGLTLNLLSQYGQKRIFGIWPEVERPSRLESQPAALPVDGHRHRSAGAIPGGHPPLPWVVRVYPAWRRVEAAQSHVVVLRLLERRGYSAARVVPTLDGTSVTTVGEAAPLQPVLVTTYIAGGTTGLLLDGLRAHGEALGRLHALPLNGRDEPGGLRGAGMLPRNELAAALSWLDGVRERVPAGLCGRCDELETACHTLDRFEAAAIPRVLIHNDCHPWNSVRTPDGQVALIDWEGAGLGPAVVDVGFVLLSADTGGIVGPVVPPEPSRVNALVDGYRRHHTLSDLELARLPDAIRFRTLAAACSNFAQAIREGRAEAEKPWYWQRYQMADEIADRARHRFERPF